MKLPYVVDEVYKREELQANFDVLATDELNGADLTDGSVSSEKLADASVTATKIAGGAVSSTELASSVQSTLSTVDVLAGLVTSGAGTPEGNVIAVVGTLYLRTDGGANTTLYVKESGTGNTGWAPK